MPNLPGVVFAARANAKRDKIELRAAVQDTVFDHCRMLRARLRPKLAVEHPDWSDEQLAEELDLLQPQYEEWDPVVMLSTMAADHRHAPELRRQAASEAAQYIRPKLKSIEIRPGTAEGDEERKVLAEKLVGLLDAAASAKRQTIEGEIVPSPVKPSNE